MYYYNMFYRRGKMESGDVDVLITHPSYTSKTSNKNLKSNLLKAIVQTLEKCHLITETISLGDTKFMVVNKCFNNLKF